MADVTYKVPAIEPGDYYFLCAVHENMNGTLQVRPEAGGRTSWIGRPRRIGPAGRSGRTVARSFAGALNP